MMPSTPCITRSPRLVDPTSIVTEIAEMERVFDRLWPLNRSLTGEGVRQTHDILNELMPLTRLEVPSGKQVFDWTVPPEWVLRDAYIVDPSGRRFADAATNNLHVVGYSEPFRGRTSRAELEKHLHSLPDIPDAIPYMTSYYSRTWGFCIRHDERIKLPDGDYDVVVDTDFKPDGSMTLSETVLEGETDEEVLISTYTCHPSMANNELSGPLVAAFLYRRLAARPHRRLTYRFAVLSETIGAVAYLSMRGAQLKQKLVGGLVATCVGLDVPFLYKRSIGGSRLIDRVTEQVLSEREIPYTAVDFYPWGSDERQYCSPGFDLPVGCLMRGNFFVRPEYHTSLDNRDLISFPAISETVSTYEAICLGLEQNLPYRNRVAYGEPQLGKYGLYPTFGALRQIEQERKDLLWLLSLSNGERDLVDIAKRSGSTIGRLDAVAQKCLAAGILERAI
jgi:aminopeptidase-like protein